MFGKKYILSLVWVLSFIGVVFSGCGGDVAQSLTFSQLISQADKYNGKTVTLEAFYFNGFEISVLSDSVGPSTSGIWRIVPTGTMIWVKGGISQDLQNKLNGQTATPSGYTERIGKLKVTGKFETGGKYGHLDAYQCQITITNAELLEWSPPPAATSGLPTYNLTEAQIATQNIVEDFIRNGSTFKFDGIEDSIKFIGDGPTPISSFRSWSYTFEFQTRHPGHGNRTGKFLAEVITIHSVFVLINLDTGAVISATCDKTWDILKEKDLPVSVRGVVVSGGDTTPPGVPMDAPRVFVYKVLRDEGVFINVSYTAYPPSPDRDAARTKITLDFYNGYVRAGDEIEAFGTLDKESNTVVVVEQGDFIKTSPRKANVFGVVVSIRGTTPSGGPGDTPERNVYELLRDDGTFVNVSYTANEGVALSLYNKAIQVGDFMKAEGMYDRNSNTVVIATKGDMIKTYTHRP